MRKSRNRKSSSAKVSRAMRKGNTSLAWKLAGIDKEFEEGVKKLAQYIPSENAFMKAMLNLTRGARHERGG